MSLSEYARFYEFKSTTTKAQWTDSRSARDYSMVGRKRLKGREHDRTKVEQSEYRVWGYSQHSTLRCALNVYD